jgi:hypothetical protein
MRLQWKKIQDDPVSFVDDLSRTGGDWIPWDPVIEAGTTDPTPGDSTINGLLTVNQGTAIVLMEYVIGSTFAGGTGGYFMIPPVKSAQVKDGFYLYGGKGMIYDTSADDTFDFHVRLAPPDVVPEGRFEFILSGTSSSFSGTTPITLATGDIIYFQVQYPIM